jgi:hypothetical protein
VVIVRTGPGLPLIRKGSHTSGVDDFSQLEVFPESTLPEGCVVAFDANIVREDPVVESVGAAAILLLY